MRPPKKINPQAHRTASHSTEDGAAFEKGRFPTPPGADQGPPADVSIEDGTGETVTSSSSGPAAQDPVRFSSIQERDMQQRSSKYNARPTTAPVSLDGDDARPDVVVEFSEQGTMERRVVVDLTKLPPSDEARRSQTFYVRHSGRWPNRVEEDVAEED